jgi:hypothetical protein
MKLSGNVAADTKLVLGESCTADTKLVLGESCAVITTRTSDGGIQSQPSGVWKRRTLGLDVALDAMLFMR